MSDSETRQCTDCQGTMGEIAILDRGGDRRSQLLEYASIDAQQSIFTGLRPVAGRVQAFMCADCSLIKLYGVPRPE